MKLGLLLVLALVAGLSESRNVTKCELRAKLQQAINLPGKLAAFKKSILAVVTCEIERVSHFDSNLVKMYGIHSPPAPVQSTTAQGPGVPGGSGITTDKATMKPANSLLTTLTTTTTTTTAPMVSAEVMGTTSSSDNITGPMRVKRGAKSGRGKSSEKNKGKNKSEESVEVEDNRDRYSEMSDQEVLSEEENKFDEVEMENDDETLEGSSEEKKHKGSNEQPTPWSLSYYGLFQLTDSHFCDSGYRWSRNVCHSPCSAFADDDISDDIACLVNSNYWRFILRDAARECYHQKKTYFDEC